jgi:hypothetical protein
MSSNVSKRDDVQLEGRTNRLATISNPQLPIYVAQVGLDSWYGQAKLL